jgi:hypothetical protein
MKERLTDSRTYAALPIAPVIIGRETFLPADTVSPLQRDPSRVKRPRCSWSEALRLVRAFELHLEATAMKLKDTLKRLSNRLLHPALRDSEIIKTLSGLPGVRPFLYEFKLGPLFLISAWLFLFHANYSGAAEDWILYFFGGFTVVGVLSLHKSVMRFLYRIAQFDKPVEGQDRTIMITAETVTLLGFLMAAMIFLNEFQSTGFGM